MKLYVMILTVVLSTACSVEKDRNQVGETTAVTQPKMLVINEYSPKSNVLNEFDEPADWIELYNPSATDVTFGDGEISITDNPAQGDRFFLPAFTIPAFGHLVIWCDDKDTVARDIMPILNCPARVRRSGFSQEKN